MAPSTSRVNGPADCDSEMTAIASGGDSASMIVPVSRAAATVTDASWSRSTNATTPDVNNGTAMLIPTTCSPIARTWGRIRGQTRWLPATNPMTPRTTEDTPGKATSAASRTVVMASPAKAPTTR